MSPFFIRIKKDVLAIIACVPRGRVITFKDVGEHIDVVPRHVAYILSQLDNVEQAQIPWYRAVAQDGVISIKKANLFGISQQDLLLEEGIHLKSDRAIFDFNTKLIAVADLDCLVPKQSRPIDAPSGSKKKL
jgi:methylated-DNA-protein-cysteine methyltransferase related protein